MKVVIAGGSGMLGRALARSLVTDGAEVVALSRTATAADALVGRPCGALGRSQPRRCLDR